MQLPAGVPNLGSWEIGRGWKRTAGASESSARAGVASSSGWPRLSELSGWHGLPANTKVGVLGVPADPWARHPSLLRVL